MRSDRAVPAEALTGETREQFRQLEAFTPRTVREQGRKIYSCADSLARFGSLKYGNQGLSAQEQELYDRHLIVPGKALVIGCGAGRETVALSRRGCRVTGIDHVPFLIDIARKFADAMHLRIVYRSRDVHEYFPRGRYQVIAFSIYHLIATMRLRRALLRRFAKALSPTGFILVYFQHPTSRCRIQDPGLQSRLKRVNRFYEAGDYFWQGTYIHYFSDSSLADEAAACGLKIADISHGKYGIAVLKLSE